MPNLSEQELVDCSRSYGNLGCNGGMMNKAYKYIMAKNINKQIDYPYKGFDQVCSSSLSGIGSYKMTSFKLVSQGVNYLKAALL